MAKKKLNTIKVTGFTASTVKAMSYIHTALASLGKMSGKETLRYLRFDKKKIAEARKSLDVAMMILGNKSSSISNSIDALFLEKIKDEENTHCAFPF